MAESENPASIPPLPAARIVNRRRLSIVWTIPFVAALITGYLVYRSISDRGPTIQITFRSADGLEAGKTRIKYRELEMGVVDTIELADDLSHVVVTAKMKKSTGRFLTERTRFWVVRANVTAGGVSGLGTLFSGAYIAMDPVEGEKERWDFEGLEAAPLVISSEPGRRFVLRSPTQGSMQIGSPIYFRQVRVGEVLRADLDERGDHVNLDIFIRAPHDQRVRETTRFWNVSGISMTVGGEGLKVDTESVVSMLIGGAAFETPDSPTSKPAKEGTVFDLFANRQEMAAASTEAKARYVLQFDGSVSGLGAGSAVEFRGIRVGQVVSTDLEYDDKAATFHIPVVVDLEPDRLGWSGDAASETAKRLAELVKRGLRGQLRTANLLTGAKVVDLDFHPDAAHATIVAGKRYPEIPTVANGFDGLQTSVARLVAKLEGLPLDGIGQDLRGTLQGLTKTLGETRDMLQGMKTDVLPGASKTFAEAEKTLAAVRALVDSDSPSSRELKRTLIELGQAARSIRLLAEHLERNPEDLLRGRKDDR